MSFCSELNAKLDTIIAELGDLAACCGSAEVIYGNPPDYNLDGTGLVPQAVVDAGYASGTSDWTGYADYKCMAAHILVENLKATVDSFGSLVETAGITVVKVAGVLASAWFAWITGGASIIILGKFVVSDFIIWEALEALGNWVAADLHDLVGDIEDIRDLIVCAAINADGAYDIKSDVDDVLDANLSATAAALVKLANTQTKINAFFAPVYGDVDVAAWLADYGADVADYDCDICGAFAKLGVTGYTGGPEGLYVEENTQYQLTSVAIAGYYGIDIAVIHVNGAASKDAKITLHAISGWTSHESSDRKEYIVKATSPYWQEHLGLYNFNWNQSLPYVILNTEGFCGFGARSDTPFTMTVSFTDVT